ncbi:MAG: undecaprenyldiphospho-muramoylpentapeptide beta-N-acetylglucosaminyltransferase [Thiotrichales bacterium]
MNQSGSRPVLIMAGGTGGHIFPALAVADALRRRGVPVLWLGSKDKMETRIVPQHGYELFELPIAGVRGTDLRTRLLAPFALIRAVGRALGVMRRIRPRAVLGMGGFAAGPGGLAAAMLRIPLYIHEQNAIPGLTNRWLARLATEVFEGFPQSFEALGFRRTVHYTGNPLRHELLTVAPARARLAEGRGALRVFVVGGSLGALKLNQTVPRALALLPQEARPQIWHQCGDRHLDLTRAEYAQAGVAARIDAFVTQMAEPYGWADLVVARAGALTVAELAQCGLPAVLVPYPHAVDDHQTANARSLVARGAAVLIPDIELTPERLAAVLFDLNRDRADLMRMSEASHGLSRPDAAEVIAATLAGGSHNLAVALREVTL